MPLKRGMVIDVNLDPVKGSETGKVRPCVIVTNDTYNARVPMIQVTPITTFTEKKGRITTNVIIEPTERNGLSRQSVADCLQTLPIDHQSRFVAVRDKLDAEVMARIDQALRRVFSLT